MSQNNKKYSINQLIAVMEALRTPQTGCPWDLKQTFETIAPYTIEEAYEVADAIQRSDMVDLKEELGDLLLQVVYHARIAQEQELFSFEDVVDAVSQKMIRRHPHVFGSAEERASGAQPGFWENVKAAEKKARDAERAAAESPHSQENPSALDGVPQNMTALTRAVKLQNRAAQVGFDWPTLAPVLAKMREELEELDEALSQQGSDQNQINHIKEEFGDLLFVLANVARHLKMDPEDTLRQANAKFERRFRGIEQYLNRCNRDIKDTTLGDLDEIWNSIKLQEKIQK